MATVFGVDPRQPKVICQECGTELGEGTTKDVFSHLVTCLHVEPNSLDNIADAARDAKNEHGRRVLYIVEALQESAAQGILAARGFTTPVPGSEFAEGGN